MPSLQERKVLGVIGIFFLAAPLVFAQQAASSLASHSTNAPRNEEAGQKHERRVRANTVVRFGFDILNLETDHQFEGQQNSFHVMYEMREC
jgi:hypothetical protein